MGRREGGEVSGYLRYSMRRYNLREYRRCKEESYYINVPKATVQMADGESVSLTLCDRVLLGE
jgi:hypothetical protein